jgi:hypothetical protein
MRSVTGSAVLLLLACGGSPRPAGSADFLPASAQPPETLVLAAPGGAEVWFTGARTARRADGSSCLERAMEIRRGPERRPIPLLYTGAAPRLVNDSTIEARIWRECAPGHTYRVNLRTGLPVRVR